MAQFLRRGRLGRHAKYADVVKTAEVLSFFDTLDGSLYNAPKAPGSASLKVVA